MSRGGPGALLLPRLIGALTLRSRVYDEVARDTGAGVQAGILILVVGVLEASVDAAVHGDDRIDSGMILLAVVAAIFGLILWSAILWGVGSRYFERPVDFPAVVRGVAFAHAPSLFYGLAAIPGLTAWAGLIALTSLIWFTAALYPASKGIFQAPPPLAARIFGLSLGLRFFVVEALPYAFRIVPGLS